MELNKSLIKGSFILLIAFNIYNALNFFFHFAMVRLLPVIEYGILATLFSIIYFLAVFTETIQTIITKYTAREHNKGKLKNILNKSFRRSAFISIPLLILYLIISIPLSYLLKITYPLMALNGLMIVLAFVIPINRGFMQGRKRFIPLGINMIVEAVVKLIFAIVFVFIGLSVYGALIGTILGVSISFSLSFLNIKDVIKVKEEKADTHDIYGYTKPAFLVILILLAFYSIDVVIAKVLFPEEIAGFYAIASILAKTIFFGTLPISKAMFPISAQNNLNKKLSQNVFINALAILLLVIFIALIAFYFIPGFIVKVFSGRLILESIQILFYLGVAISLISLTNFILLYKLSLGKIKGHMYLFIFILIEIFLLIYFSKNLFEFSIAFITASAAFLWGSIVLMNE